MADDRAHEPGADAEWESMARYLAGECTPDEERLVRERLAGNAEQRAMLAALDAALTSIQPEPLTSTEVESALQAVRTRAALEDSTAPSASGVGPLRERPTAQIARLRWQWHHAGLRAAAAVLVVAGASLLWREIHQPAPIATRATPASHYATSIGKVDTVKLADGTRVVLGPSSTLDVAGGFGVPVRDVSLNGEAFFDVVHDQHVPFVVRTSQATLRDVGTSFAVRSDVDRGTRVAVTSGAVDVVAAHAGAGSPVVLRAGDRAVIDVDGVRRETGTASDEDLRWTQGVLVFRDAPLNEVAVGLRRWFGIELVVTDSAIAKRRLTATFERGTTDEVGGVLAAALGGSVRRSGDTLRLGSASPTR